MPGVGALRALSSEQRARRIDARRGAGGGVEKCKREATFANLGPFEDVRKLSGTDNESLDIFPPAPLVPR